MSFNEMMEVKESEIRDIQSILSKIPNGRKVLSKKIEDERNLLDAGLVAGLNDNTSLVELENELLNLNEKEEGLIARLNDLNNEIDELIRDEKRLKTIEGGILYYKTLKKFADWKIKQIKKSQKDKEFKSKNPPEDIINNLATYKNNPIVIRALPFKI